MCSSDLEQHMAQRRGPAAAAERRPRGRRCRARRRRCSRAICSRRAHCRNHDRNIRWRPSRRSRLHVAMRVQRHRIARTVASILGRNACGQQWETPAKNRKCATAVTCKTMHAQLFSGLSAGVHQTSYVHRRRTLARCAMRDARRSTHGDRFARYETADKSNGVSRNRLPVNRNTAFAIAGVTAGLDSSPTPPGFARSPCTM